jgi:hypothetical protein
MIPDCVIVFCVCNIFEDVMGFMTGISDEREYVRDGKITKMVVFELTDKRFDQTSLL